MCFRPWWGKVQDRWQSLAEERVSRIGDCDTACSAGGKWVPGGGRKSAVVLDPTLRDDLERLVEPTSRGDPESPLRWTLKSVRKLAAELTAQGHQTSHRVVAELLHEMGYSLQANQKTLEGTDHVDGNAQLDHLNGAVQQQLWAGEPSVSVDTKKKLLVGPFKN